MDRTPAYPLAEHPFDDLRGQPRCSLARLDRTDLTMVMIENSLRQCASLVKGTVLINRFFLW
jgi:hypothetical protein